MINYMLYTWFQLLILYFRTNMQNEKTLPENNTHTNTRVCVCVMHVNFIISKYVCNNYQASVLKFLRFNYGSSTDQSMSAKCIFTIHFRNQNINRTRNSLKSRDTQQNKQIFVFQKICNFDLNIKFRFNYSLPLLLIPKTQLVDCHKTYLSGYSRYE